MLGKVLKYDIKSIFGSVKQVYLILFVISIISRIVSELAKKIEIFSYILPTIYVGFIIFIMFSLFYTFIIIIKRFYTNLFKDEAYLTHTLPVKKITLLNSKILSSFLYIIISIVVVITSLLIAFYTKGMIGEIFNNINLIIQSIGLSPSTLITFFVAYLILSYMSLILAIYSSITIGHSFDNNKIENSIISGVVMYLINQFANLSGLCMMFVLNPNIKNYINGNIPPSDMLFQLLTIIIGIQAIFVIINYILTLNIMNKKLNLG